MKEDDMDEMLREAAENYNIDADKAADWNAVYNAVHETESSAPVEEKKRKRGFVFWWLFLIPLGWIAHTEYNKFNTADISAKSAATTSKTDAIKAKATSGNYSPDAKTPENKITANSSSTQSNQKTIAQSAYYKKPANHNLENNVVSSNQTSLYLSNQPKMQSFAEANNGANDNNVTASPAKIENANLPLQVTPNNQQSKQDVIPNVNNDKAIQPIVTATAKKSSSIKIKSNGHYFYAGLVAGADLSFVKYQQVEPLGYNVGLLVGYKFNKISIESGLYLAKKNYYTDGEYFDKSKIPFFNNAELQSVNGYCSMYEIPLNVKYDFASSKRHTWFAAAGLSSYLMNKEFYNYSYEKDGQQHTGSYPYYHTTQDWFSVINVSAGYQLQTGVKTNLRIEPYFKSTLNGVGTGSLSISSAGINIGLVRRIP